MNIWEERLGNMKKLQNQRKKLYSEWEKAKREFIDYYKEINEKLEKYNFLIVDDEEEWWELMFKYKDKDFKNQQIGIFGTSYISNIIQFINEISLEKVFEYLGDKNNSENALESNNIIKLAESIKKFVKTRDAENN